MFDKRLTVIVCAALGWSAASFAQPAQPQQPSQVTQPAQPAPAAPPAQAAADKPRALPLPRPGVDTLRALIEAETQEASKRARDALDRAKGPAVDSPQYRAQLTAAAVQVAPEPLPQLIEIAGPADDLRARLRLGDREVVLSMRQPTADPWRLQQIGATDVVVSRTEGGNEKKHRLAIHRPPAGSTAVAVSRAPAAPMPLVPALAPPLAPSARPVAAPLPTGPLPMASPPTPSVRR